jgi:hypothetical protein
MKTSLLLLPFVLLTLTTLPACRKKTTGEKIGDKIDDALDQRPGEKSATPWKTRKSSFWQGDNFKMPDGKTGLPEGSAPRPPAKSVRPAG